MGRWNPEPASDQQSEGRAARTSTPFDSAARRRRCDEGRIRHTARPFRYSIMFSKLQYLDDEAFTFNLQNVNEDCGLLGTLTIGQNKPGNKLRFIQMPLAAATMLAAVVRHFRKRRRSLGHVETVGRTAWEALPPRSIRFRNEHLSQGKGKGQFQVTGVGIFPVWIQNEARLSIELVRERGGIHRCGGEQRVAEGATLQIPMWAAAAFGKDMSNLIEGE